MIVARNIKKRFGNLEVLKGVDIEISPGEIVSIVGPSGAGKSTLLHIIGTLMRPSNNDYMLKINGTDLHKLSDKKLSMFRNKHIGFVFQFHHLLPEFNAMENVAMPAYIAGQKKSTADKRAMQLLSMLGLKQRALHRPSELSGGEQQRVAVARALMNRPAIVLADEPSGNLDSQNARHLHELFLKLRDETGQTFLIVTHNKELATMSDRILRMQDGYVLQGELNK